LFIIPILHHKIMSSAKGSQVIPQESVIEYFRQHLIDAREEPTAAPVQISTQLSETSEILKSSRQIAWAFISTGIFAAIGALYCWGDGSLFNAPAGTDLEIYIADLLITAPLSLISGYGFIKYRRWAIFAGIFTAGLYIFGTALVYISVIQNGVPYLLKLVIPPIFGIIFSVVIIYWSWQNFDLLLKI
jgi:hypothetical protein